MVGWEGGREGGREGWVGALEFGLVGGWAGWESPCRMSILKCQYPNSLFLILPHPTPAKRRSQI